MGFLARGRSALDRAAPALAVEEAVVVHPATAVLPFVPRSMRAFMLWESQSTRLQRSRGPLARSPCGEFFYA